MSKKTHFSRRRMLQGLGLGATAAATIPLWTPRLSVGAPGDIPKRVIFVSSGSGAIPGLWEPRPVGGAPEPTRTSFELGELYAALEPYKDKLVLFENLDMLSRHGDPTEAGNAHVDGQTHQFVADYRASDELGGNISIDQYIARELHRDGPLTPLPSLEITASWYDDLNAASYSSPGQKLPYMDRPDTIYDRLFPEPIDAGIDVARGRQRDQVFRFVDAEHRQMLGRLSGADREKLQQHMEMRADLERRLGLGGSRQANRPPRSMLMPWDAVAYDYQHSGDPGVQAQTWDVLTELNTKLLVAALHTDVTRVGTLLVDDPPDQIFGYTPGQFGTQTAHHMTHAIHNGEAPSRNPQAVAMLRRWHEALVDKFVLLLDELSSKTESDGSTLLDHTLVVLTAHIANGSHDTTRLPWVTVGDLDGTLRTGQYIRHARVNDRGRAHNDLYVSVARAMGVHTMSFGRAEVCTGPIAEMFA